MHKYKVRSIGPLSPISDSFNRMGIKISWFSCKIWKAKLLKLWNITSPRVYGFNFLYTLSNFDILTDFNGLSTSNRKNYLDFYLKLKKLNIKNFESLWIRKVILWNLRNPKSHGFKKSYSETSEIPKISWVQFSRHFHWSQQFFSHK